MDIVEFFNLFDQTTGDGFSCSVGRMNDPTLAMAAFSGEMIISGIYFFGKLYTLSNSPFYGFLTMFNSIFYCILMAQTCTSNKRILDMGFNGIVGFIQYGSNASLGIKSRTFCNG